MRMAQERRERTLAYDAARAWCEQARKAEYVWDVDQHCWFIRSATGVWERDRLGLVRSEMIKAAQSARPDDTGNWARYFDMVATCQDGVTITRDQWDTHMYAFGAPSGVFELIEGCSLERVYDLKITKQVGASPGGSSDLWERFLLECCEGDEEVVSFLQRWAGYALSGLTVEHVILFVHGPGGNGKSVFVDTLRHAWGEYARTMPMDALMEAKNDRHPAEIAMLAGARLAIATETQEGRRWDDAKVKQLTGGDRIVARHMRQDWFEFDPTFKLLVVGNHAPQIATVDDAMRRRLCMVPFNNKPAMPDPTLGQRLKQEAGGVLRWAMEGFEAFRQAGGLNPPERVLKATQAYLDEQDTVGAWLQDCCIVGDGGWTASADLFRSWEAWCRDAGIHAKSIKRLSGDLARRGIPAERRKHGRGFGNVRVTLGDALVTDQRDGYWP
jgi:putative DNA primase/helicase